MHNSDFAVVNFNKHTDRLMNYNLWASVLVLLIEVYSLSRAPKKKEKCLEGKKK